MLRTHSLLLVAVLCLVGCNSSAERAPGLGEAYVGPLTLNLRQELAPKSPVTAVVKHGERLEILQVRRRFNKVRTAQGAEGWTDSSQLLMPDQMAELRRTSAESLNLPSQGKASVYETLNMHTEPARQSPSFYQIPENGSVEVIGHQLAPRVQAAPPVAAPAPVKPRARRKGKSRESDQFPRPSPPAPPPPPANWLELSKPAGPAPVRAEASATPMDDWSLVRTKDGKAGWVLSRMLNMGIPDEVAQYAEGHRITSYFALGAVKDRGETKPNWLWTTITQNQQPYEFDSFRVFVWSIRHHRYETAYIERNVRGFYPVEPHGNSFAVVLQEKTGLRYRRVYAFEGFRVRMTGKTRVEPPTLPTSKRQTAKAAVPPAAEQASLWSRIKGGVARLFHRQ